MVAKLIGGIGWLLVIAAGAALLIGLTSFAHTSPLGPSLAVSYWVARLRVSYLASCTFRIANQRSQ
jgi:hypothetical protein